MIYQYSSNELTLYTHLFCPRGLTTFVFSRDIKKTVLTRITMKSALGTAQTTAHRMGTAFQLAYTKRLYLHIAYWVLDITCHALNRAVVPLLEPLSSGMLVAFINTWQAFLKAFCAVCQCCLMRLHLKQESWLIPDWILNYYKDRAIS